MWKTIVTFTAAAFISFAGNGQQKTDSLAIDTTLYNYDEIFSELDALIDSLYSPRSFVTATMGMGSGYFTYAAKNNTSTTIKKLIFSPSVGVYDKSGLGLTISSSVMNDSGRINAYQFSLSGSYDYLQNRALATGLSLTHYFTQPDANFYTSPLKNELYAYFTYRDSWLKPSIAGSYGWGSRSAVERRSSTLSRIRRAIISRQRDGVLDGTIGGGAGMDSLNTETTTYEKIADMNLLVSVRHDFYFLHLLTKKDYIRLTPMVSMSFGTQQFGFNSVSNTSLVSPKTGTATVIRTRNINLDNNLSFQPLSLTVQLRTEYAIGKFFIQPQLFADYYFPADENKLTANFLLTTGFIF